jgi:6,7-dimethyl-8-ribityllumazine synthase
MDQQDQTQITAKIAFIKARWHSDIVDQAEIGFRQTVSKLNIADSDIDVYEVPGAFDAPYLAKNLASSERYDVIVVAGFVVDGGIYRHDFVAATVVEALMQIQLQQNVPVLSVVLTPHNYQETDVHNDFFRAHFVEKGAEAARAVDLILANEKQIAKLHEGTEKAA